MSVVASANYTKLMTFFSIPYYFRLGTDGWSFQLKLSSRHKISEIQYYVFHSSIRPHNYILMTIKLFQQFTVDAYAKIECGRLQYLRHQQGKLTLMVNCEMPYHTRTTQIPKSRSENIFASIIPWRPPLYL
ncbi:hypothetical protein ElyMa_001025800 [Elysia marginata]|uniref:Helitron helicase-like domain-containing protein n=1 Tax=Elysia marginata TaxID=1093978 RepID=A0AAV4HLG3_9GAST|nr:hypothetical protein ElyMa_001025800 [Elysia marginata]